MLAVFTTAAVEARFNGTRRKAVFVLSTSALFWIPRLESHKHNVFARHFKQVN